MDTLRRMLLSLLIGATVSTGPTYTEEPEPLPTAAIEQAATATPVLTETTAPAETVAPSASPTQMPTPTPIIIYITPEPAATATPRPAATVSRNNSTSATSIKRELSLGCEGDDVRMLQRLLKDLGYSVEVDGDFGSKTYNAVKAFQQNNGLGADGIAGTRTIRKLSSDSAVRAGSSASSRKTLSYGMCGQDVIDLQNKLADLGFYFEKSTGNYLTKTSAAVRWFQSVNGLSIDGIAGPSTLNLLFSASARAAGNSTPPASESSSTSGSFYRTLREGMSGSDVTYLQTLLKNLGYFSGRATGYFGSITYNAVYSFQLQNGLTADGVAGSATQQTLTGGYGNPYGSSGGSISYDPGYNDGSQGYDPSNILGDPGKLPGAIDVPWDLD